ncbi:MAG TPA: hypothetical protein VMA30_05040 [Xanthobacteraceae bacterium]|nr:hypothetical protein [Xanthobacteraceae bacterium]
MTAVAKPDIPAAKVVGEVSTFLIAAASALRDAVTRFEQTSAGISAHVASRPNDANRDLIVTLQAFDRLNQEFVALAEVLTFAASKSGDSWIRAERGGHPAEDAIAGVTVSELKERLQRHLGITKIDLTMLVPTGEEVVF